MVLIKVSVTLCNFFSTLQFTLAGVSWGELFDAKLKVVVGKSKRNELCACAVRESVSKIARKVAEGMIHCAMALQVAKNYTIFLLLQSYTKQKRNHFRISSYR